jgi:hypothetical protein
VISRLSSEMAAPVESALVEPSLEDVFLDVAMRVAGP